ncbi:MAG: PA2778 family cysteine peptidase [Pelomonas sp.]|nr:PA2778 family cysteine peptidase [Roseateles sp.]
MKRVAAGPLAGLLVGLLVGAGLGGCAAPPPVQQLEQSWPASLPPRVELDRVPFFAQEDHECGPAALAMLLQAGGVAATPGQLLPEVYLPGRQGALQQELLIDARRHGLPAYVLAPTLPDLLAEVAAGHPVLVFMNLSLPIYPVWHYAVAIGYDRERASLLLRSGRTERLEMSLGTFERTWARGGHWAMVALPTNELPATAQAGPFAAAVVALERLDARAARAAYATALQRWAAEPALLLGAGNAAYALGDRAGAAAAYRHAGAVRPDLADAWNNLAQVLMESGAPRAEALRAAEQAVALGGPRVALYRELAATLRAAPGARGDGRAAAAACKPAVSVAGAAASTPAERNPLSDAPGPLADLVAEPRQ